MPTLQTTQISRIDGENLINPFMLFGNAFTWNFASGSGSASNINYANSPVNRVLRIVAAGGDTLSVINSGDDSTEQTIDTEGTYVIAFDVLTDYQGGTAANANVKVTMFVNAVAYDIPFTTPSTEDEHNIWLTYYASMFLEVGDVISWQFEVQTFDVGLNCKLLFKNFKLEIPEGGFIVPSPFTLPYFGELQLIPPTVTGTYKLKMNGSVGSWQKQLEATATLNFPSASAGAENDLTISMTGAVVGSPVSVVAPSSLQGVFTAFCDTVNVVTVRHYNTTGGTYDPASGSFKVIQ